MGNYQHGSLTITVPAAAVSPIANDIRRMVGTLPQHSYTWTHPIIAQADLDVVKDALFAAEGDEDGALVCTEVDADGAITLDYEIHGKISMLSDEIRDIYARHGVTGEQVVEDDSGHVKTIFSNRGWRNTIGRVVFDDEITTSRIIHTVSRALDQEGLDLEPAQRIIDAVASSFGVSKDAGR
jgi:hypothetical protein